MLDLQIVVSLPETLDFVYNSLPYKEFDVTQNQGTSENIKIAKLANVAVIAVGKAGVMIIDSQFNQNIFPSPDDAYIQTVQITGEAKYVFSAMKKEVGVFELINYKELKLINTIDVNNIVVIDMQFHLNEAILFIIGQLGLIRWYDIRNKQNIKQIDEIVYDQMRLSKGLFSPDQSLFYLTSESDGLLVFKIKNINKSNQTEKLSIQLQRILKKKGISNFRDIVVTNKNEYVFLIDKWVGVQLLHKFTDLLIEGDNLEEKNSKIIKMETVKLGFKGYTSTLDLSSDNLYLFVGARSKGILIFNVSDPFNPVFFQQLQLTGQSVSLCLSPQLKPGIDDILNHQFIYYTNSLKVIVYQKQLPNLNRKTPNLFNIQQSKFLDSRKVAWRCKVSPSNKYFYGAFDGDSLTVKRIFLPEKSSPEAFQMQLQYQFSDQKESMERVNNLREFGPGEEVPLSFLVDTMSFSKDGKYMYFPVLQYDLNVIAYKFEIIRSGNDEYSFKYIKGLSHKNVFYCEQFDISDDELHAVMAFEVGIVLIDMVKFEVLAQLNNVGVLGSCCGAVLSHDKKYVLSVVRNIGLFIYNTSNMTNPYIINSWRTNGGETLLRSTVDNVIFFVDGFNGIKLLDSSKFPEIVVISQFITAGWSNYISFTKRESYGIISTTDTGTLTLIDLQDKYNPRLIMKSSIENYDSFASCLDSTTLEFGFSVNIKGVRYFKMQSDVYIHVERQRIEIQTQDYRMMNESEPFEVGNQYIIHFVTLYRKKNQIITDIFYYKNLVLSALPSWIQIDRKNQANGNLQTTMNIDVSKECLESKNSKISFLIIVIKSCFQLSDKSFIFSTQALSTTPEESLLIYKYLKSTGYINGLNCVTDFFDPIVKEILPLDDAFPDKIEKKKQTIIEEYVTETLKKSTFYNQFIFDVISSLKFNQKNQNQMIEALKNYISISFQLPSQSPFIFVQKMYPNLIIYFNDEQTSMKIEGELQYINQALKSKILCFDQSTKDGFVQSQTINKTINIQIIDNFNYDLSYSLKIPEEVFFLKEKSPIQIQNTLQEQLNKQYENSEFYIEFQFLITFNIQSFIDPDGIPLVYELQQEINGEYVLLPNDSFIKFDSINLRLFGTPTSKELFTVQKLRLIVKNGYTKLTEDFSLKINLMPFTYVFNRILQIFGPAAFLFGFYKKRSVFKNIYFKKKTMYTTEVAYVNQIYRKKISIIGYDYVLAHMFFQKFLKVRNKQINKKQSSLNTQNQQSSNDNIQDKTEKIKQDNHQSSMQKNDFIFTSVLSFDKKVQEEREIQSLKTKDQNTPQISEIGNLNISELNLKDKNIMKYQQNKLFQNQQLFELSPKYKSEFDSSNKDLTQERIIKNKINLQDIKFFNKNINQKSNYKKAEKTENNEYHEDYQNQIVKLNETNDLDQNDYLFIKKIVIKDNGQIEVQQLFDLMLQYNLQISYNFESFAFENYKSQIMNQYSRFFFCLKACIIRYLVQQDKKTSNFHCFLKRYSLQQGQYFENDWYKQYVSVIATNDMDINGIPVPFSNTVLKEDSLFEIYQILEYIPSNLKKENFQYQNITQFEINPHLLREILFADALGLDLISAYSIIKCKGESLHIEKHTIISVEAHKLVEKDLCLSIRQAFNRNYQRLPISKYLSIPSWMAYDFKNGVIVLEGTPSLVDIDHILIRVFDENHFTTYQFHLNIQDNTNQISLNHEVSSQKTKDENTQNRLNNINNELVLQTSLNLQNRQKSSSSQNSSTFKIAQKMTSKAKADLIIEIDETSHNSEENKNYEKDEINEEETETQKSEMDDSVKPLPLFTHLPSQQGDISSPINTKNIQSPKLIQN